MSGQRVQVLIGMIEGESRQNLIAVIRAARSFEVASVASLAGLESAASCYLPDVVVLSEEIVTAGISLGEATRRLAAFAPVIVLASSERHMELVGLVISGQVDLVTLSDGFASVVAALIERRLNSSDGYSREFRSEWSADVPSDFAEILRHEINNPLTGILGNAELLLSQLRGKLPASSVQRLETVIDLAVRLREKVRCLAAEPSSREPSVHSL
ncbi:MAG TPA: histidine kinase dimerization/phospho-acceptor domain-containing protein [Candidatus Acidoferrales bacterium]|nr:histidine kinase dimerization/phospho-acceptor domain-containing protein [Candidatus Acidoferrales bacterium]